jgi:hypothetical protein
MRSGQPMICGASSITASTRQISAGRRQADTGQRRLDNSLLVTATPLLLISHGPKSGPAAHGSALVSEATLLLFVQSGSSAFALTP